MEIARSAVIAVPFFDTPENGRAKHTIDAIGHLADVIAPPHRVYAIDNGSTDPSAGMWIKRRNMCNLVTYNKPASIAQAVNWVWHEFERHLDEGVMIAVKHDSDLQITPHDQGWVDNLLHLFNANPDIYLGGVRFDVHDYLGSNWVKEDHKWWFESPFVYGGVQARSPIGWKKIGYSRQPWGRWGWGDHWDAFRVDHLGGKMGILWDYEFKQTHKQGALGQEYKRECREKALEAFGKLQEEVKNGTRPIRESNHDTDELSKAGEYAPDSAEPAGPDCCP